MVVNPKHTTQDVHARCAALQNTTASGLDAPLPSALAMRIADAQQRLGRLASRAEDLAASLTSLETRQRAFVPTPSSRHVYASLGHVTSLLAAQSAAVEALATRLDGLGVDADTEDGPSPAPSRRSVRSGVLSQRSPAPASSWHSVRTSPLVVASPGRFLVPAVAMEGQSDMQAWGERGQLLATQALRMVRVHVCMAYVTHCV